LWGRSARPPLPCRRRRAPSRCCRRRRRRREGSSGGTAPHPSPSLSPRPLLRRRCRSRRGMRLRPLCRRRAWWRPQPCLVVTRPGRRRRRGGGAPRPPAAGTRTTMRRRSWRTLPCASSAWMIPPPPPNMSRRHHQPPRPPRSSTRLCYPFPRRPLSALPVRSMQRRGGWLCSTGPSRWAAWRCAAAFPSCARSMLTEIYLCHACSCYEILSGNAAVGVVGDAAAGGVGRRRRWGSEQ
jgi:hypothetical protein